MSFSVRSVPERLPSAVARLSAELEYLPPSLRRVAGHVLTHREETVYQTITELAAATGVGESTVTRLCRRLGFSGFHAFKIALTGDVSRTVPAGVLDPLEQAGSRTIAALQATLQQGDSQAFVALAARLVAAARIEIFGQSNSGLCAQYLAARLMRLGLPAYAHTDPHLGAVAAASQGPKGVCIGVSLSGSTLDTVQTLQLAQRSGAYTVALTHRAASPIARHADLVLLSAQAESPLDSGDVSSLVSQLMLAEGIYLALVQQLPDAPEWLRRTAESVTDKKY
ncbi:MurR/RpiR family transcriptional regulator [Deinococcus lacus]|uniref:MurR/RpiR family transcriptional regulator n=1 Tax=Deinococcus lacus TaxID=392561 RepID=A0ABW1YEL5_9DEIO